MQYISYLAVMHRVPRRAYAAWFPDLPHCFAGGDTRDALELHAHRALLRLAEAAAARGESLPAPSSIEAVLALPDVQAAVRSGSSIIDVLLVSKRPSRRQAAPE